MATLKTKWTHITIQQINTNTRQQPRASQTHRVHCAAEVCHHEVSYRVRRLLVLENQQDLVGSTANKVIDEN